MSLPRLRINILLISFLLLQALISSSVLVEGFHQGRNMINAYDQTLDHKEDGNNGIQIINTRKLLADLLDYDDAGANRRHDPRKPGVGGGKN